MWSILLCLTGHEIFTGFSRRRPVQFCFPTLAFVGPSGKVAIAPQGAQTLSQAQVDLQQTLSS
ncbi:MAG: hypothetical protein ACYCOU_08440 [Sulfobacillus sp.]